VSGYPPIETIVPHRAPMILLDLVEDDGAGYLRCSVTPRAGSPFVENGAVPAVVAAEYMAQCVAAYTGLAAVRRGDPVRIGYLLGTRSMELEVAAFEVGETLIVEARHVWGDAALGQFDCAVRCAGRRVAAAVLNVFAGDLEETGTAAGAAR
jgi:predicted hotdog family 3-hydroxylacyl-ACP dehydratase